MPLRDRVWMFAEQGGRDCVTPIYRRRRKTGARASIQLESEPRRKYSVTASTARGCSEGFGWGEADSGGTIGAPPAAREISGNPSGVTSATTASHGRFARNLGRRRSDHARDVAVTAEQKKSSRLGCPTGSSPGSRETTIAPDQTSCQFCRIRSMVVVAEPDLGRVEIGGRPHCPTTGAGDARAGITRQLLQAPNRPPVSRGTCRHHGGDLRSGGRVPLAQGAWPSAPGLMCRAVGYPMPLHSGVPASHQ